MTVSPSKSAPLGIYTEFASGLQKELDKENRIRDLKTARYRLRTRAGELLPDFRVNTACGLPIIPDRSPELWLDLDSGRSHFKGLTACGSAWVCPVCSAKISMGRREEIREALRLSAQLGWKPLLITLTARHNRDDNLEDLFNAFKRAKRYMRSGRKWQSVKQDYLVKGSITSTEITWGFENGHHVHFHEIFFVGAYVDAEEIEERFYQLWSLSLDREGLDCSREHGVDVQVGNEKIGDYVTKWGLDNELASINKAAKKGNFTPFQLLALYDQGEDWAGWLFQEYADVTKGKVSLRWSRGLRDKLDLGRELTDQELAEERISQNSVRLIRFTKEEYYQILYSGRDAVIGEMLSVAESGRDALLIWLDAIFGIHPEAPT